MVFSENQLTVIKIYVAAFVRAPEKEGFEYWHGLLDKGTSTQDFTKIVFDLYDVRQIYPKTQDEQSFVATTYRNVLGKDPDAAGLAYWLDRLPASGGRGSLVLEIINAALNTPDGTPGKAYIVNRMDAAKYAVEQQLTTKLALTTPALIDLAKTVGAEASSLAAGRAAIDAAIADAHAHGPAAPTNIQYFLSGSVYAGELTTWNRELTVTANISSKDAAGGSARLFFNGKEVSYLSQIPAGENTLTFKFSDASLVSRIATMAGTGSLEVSVVLYDVNGHATSSADNPRLIVNAGSILRTGFNADTGTIFLPVPANSFTQNPFVKADQNAATTDIKASLDWSKFYWDIDGDNPGKGDIRFTVEDIASATMPAYASSGLTLTLNPSGLQKILAARQALPYTPQEDAAGYSAGFLAHGPTGNSLNDLTSLSIHARGKWEMSVDALSPDARFAEQTTLTVRDANSFDPVTMILRGSLSDDILKLRYSGEATLDLTRSSVDNFYGWESITLSSSQDLKLVFGDFAVMPGPGKVSLSMDSGSASSFVDASRLKGNGIDVTGSKGNDSFIGSVQDDTFNDSGGRDRYDLRTGGEDQIIFRTVNSLPGAAPYDSNSWDTIVGFQPGPGSDRDAINLPGGINSWTVFRQSLDKTPTAQIIILDAAFSTPEALQNSLNSRANWKENALGHLLFWKQDNDTVTMGYERYYSPSKSVEVYKLAEFVGLPNMNADFFLATLSMVNFYSD